MVDIKQAKLTYLISVIGVVLMGAATATGWTSAFSRPEQGFGGDRPLGNMKVGNVTAVANMYRGNANPFGMTDVPGVIGLIIAIVGLAWVINFEAC